MDFSTGQLGIVCLAATGQYILHHHQSSGAGCDGSLLILDSERQSVCGVLQLYQVSPSKSFVYLRLLNILCLGPPASVNLKRRFIPVWLEVSSLRHDQVQMQVRKLEEPKTLIL